MSDVAKHLTKMRLSHAVLSIRFEAGNLSSCVIMSRHPAPGGKKYRTRRTGRLYSDAWSVKACAGPPRHGAPDISVPSPSSDASCCRLGRLSMRMTSVSSEVFRMALEHECLQTQGIARVVVHTRARMLHVVLIACGAPRAMCCRSVGGAQHDSWSHGSPDPSWTWKYSDQGGGHECNEAACMRVCLRMQLLKLQC